MRSLIYDLHDEYDDPNCISITPLTFILPNTSYGFTPMPQNIFFFIATKGIWKLQTQIL